MEKLTKEEHLCFSPFGLQSKNYSDVVIQCHDGVYNGVQSVLAMASTFLRNIIKESHIMNCDFNPQKDPSLVLFIPDASKQQVSLVFRLFVTGKLENMNVEDVVILKNIWKLLKIDCIDIRSLEVSTSSEEMLKPTNVKDTKLMDNEETRYKENDQSIAIPDRNPESEEDKEEDNNDNTLNILSSDQNIPKLMEIETSKKDDHHPDIMIEEDIEDDKALNILLSASNMPKLMEIETERKDEHDEDISKKDESIQYEDMSSLIDAESDFTPAFSNENIQCQYCDKAFSAVGRLVSHLKTHLVELDTKQVHLKCTVNDCNYQLSIVSNSNKRVPKYSQLPILEDHLRAKHTKEKKHQCSECQKYFFSYPALRYHVKQHKFGSKLFCQGCDHFIKKAQFTEHTTNQCTSSSKMEKPYKCDYCDKSFLQKGNCKTHIIKTHPNSNQCIRSSKMEKPFKCDYCDKSFSQKGNCKTHIIKTHSN